MNRKIIAMILCAALLFVTLSCQLLSRTAAPTATVTLQEAQAFEATTELPPDLAATEQAVQEAAQAAEESALATEQAALLEAERATEEAIRAAATAEVAVILTEEASFDFEATAEAQGMYNAVEQLAAEGLIEDTNGTYARIDDFNENWAQIGWYQWWGTGLAPTDFVIRAHTEWESASKTANWFDSGCGFVFREEDADNHYMIFLALDSNVYLKGYVDGVYKEFGKGSVGKINHLKGGADVMLVVEGDHILYFVNDQKVLDKRVPVLSSGNLALTLVSGTNKDFGTRCSITDIDLWMLGE